MRSFLVITMICAASGCSDRIETEKDDRPPFRIDSTQPFRIELGRGSGRHGLDTIRLDETGLVVMHRQLPIGNWQTARLQLSPNFVAEIIREVDIDGLMQLHRTYQRPDIADGTQWVLWIKQGANEKSVYLNNSLPQQIQQFAERLDAVLSAAVLNALTWQPVPTTEARRHERELWHCIQTNAIRADAS